MVHRSADYTLTGHVSLWVRIYSLSCVISSPYIMVSYNIKLSSIVHYYAMHQSKVQVFDGDSYLKKTKEDP